MSGTDKTVVTFTMPCCCLSCDQFEQSGSGEDYECYCLLDEDGDWYIEDVYGIIGQCPKLRLNGGKKPECTHGPGFPQTPPEPIEMDLDALLKGKADEPAINP